MSVQDMQIDTDISRIKEKISISEDRKNNYLRIWGKIQVYVYVAVVTSLIVAVMFVSQ